MKLWSRVICSLAALFAATALYAADFSEAMDYALDKSADNEFVSAIILLPSAIDIQTLDFALHQRKATVAERNREVIEALMYNAAQNQPAFQAELDQEFEKGNVLGYTAYWIDNLFVVYAKKSFLETLRERGDIDYVTTNFTPELIEPIRSNGKDGAEMRPRRRNPLDNETTTTEQDAIGCTRVNRELGITGQGVLVANCDTGVDGTHPALASRWRGNFAPVAECWRDAAGLGHATPQDGNGHGTHVMGTMTGRAISGSDTNTVGSAPNARWIASNTINQGTGTNFDNDVIADYQWFANPDGNINTTEDLPDVIQNSWGVHSGFAGYTQCDTRWNTFILNCEAAGPVVTWSAGNEASSGLRTPAIHSMSAYQIFSVGAVDAQDGLPPYPIASFSSLGPTPCTPASPDNIKPEISAPGVNIYSSVPGGGYDGVPTQGLPWPDRTSRASLPSCVKRARTATTSLSKMRS
ncbi:MAG: S8 family serine peptidase [bacterium]|nr:S8 family serine peptidase [bacterium]